VSWVNELVPSGISAREVVAVLSKLDDEYKRAGLPQASRLAFHCLRIIQLVAYASGWRVGRRRLRNRGFESSFAERRHS